MGRRGGIDGGFRGCRREDTYYDKLIHELVLFKLNHNTLTCTWLLYCVYSS